MKPRHRRLLRDAVSSLLILSIACAALPPGLIPAWLPTSAPQPAAAETLESPRYVSAAVMPNGHVGFIFLNVTGSGSAIRFVRYTDEYALESSVQLSTAAPAYPQLALIGSTLVAAYVDTRSPNAGKLIFRTSTDNGASWSAESNPFGSETFDTSNFAPRVVASHDGATLYVFTAASNARPYYRSSTNVTSWSSAAVAGDSSMRVATGNNCGSAGQECYRAHTFGFMETATSGTWVYVSKSDSGWAQSGRGTQVGSLGGSWSTQVDHGGSGGASGGGESTATTFLDRDGAVYYVRAGGYGENLYYEKSTDDGAHWDSRVYAYAPNVGNYVAAAPVGLYVSGYTWGEYVWYAGFSGTQDSLRVVPLWTSPQPYARTGTMRLLGSAGGDLDEASAFPYNFGDAVDGLGAGGYTTSQTDLALPGRLLPLSFTRTYNSGDPGSSALAPGWSHSFDWSLQENGDRVTLKRASGQRDRFTRNTDGTYANPPGVFDTLTKNTDGTFTLTTPGQIKYEFGAPGTAYSSLIASASPVAYWRLGESSGTTATDATSNHLNGTYSGTYALHLGGAIVSDANTSVTFAGGYADMGSPSALNISATAISIEFWAKGSPGAYNYLVSHTDGGSQGYAVYTGGDGTYHFYMGRGGGLHVTGSVTGTWDQQWHHFVNLYDGSAMKVYVDGVARLTETETSSLTGYTGNFSVARYNGGGYGFSGSLDEVAVYSRVLSSSEINDHYLAGIGPKSVLTRIHEPAGNQMSLSYTGPRLSKITDTVGREVTLGYDSSGRLQTLTDNAGRVVRYGLDIDGRLAFVWDRLATSNPGAYADRVLANSPAAYWRLGEASGTSASDASGNGVTGTYNGTVTQGVTGAISGDSNKAISVAGSGYVTASGSGGLNVTGSALTVEGWVKGASQANYTYIVSKSDGSGSVGYTLYTGSTGTLSFFVHTSVSGLVTATAPTSPWDNQWHYVVGTYDGGNVRLYIDGGQVASTAATGTVTSSSSVTFNLGRYNGGGYAFSGSLDEFAVSASALSQADIVSRLYGAPSWRYTYDGVTRHIATVTDPDGRMVATNTFDSLGRLASQDDGLSNTTTLDYGSSTLTMTDPRGHETLQTFDARSRLVEVEDTVGANTYTVAYTYDDCGNRSSVIDRNGNRTDYTYDTACKGNLLTIEEPELDPYTARFTTTWTYDSKSNPTQKTDAKGSVSTWTYDATTNVVLSATAPIDASTSATTKWIYGDTSNPGLPTRMVAPRGNTTGTPNNTYSTVLAYDSSANLTSSTDADGSQTTYGYDTVGRRTSMVDPDGNASGGTPSQHTWTTAYDALDRITSSTDALSHSSSTTYDGWGHVLTSTDKNGNVTTYTYDAAGRLATVAQKPDPSGQPTLTYTTTIGRDDNGNATAMTQANSVVTNYAFDALNRLTSMTTHPGGGTNLATTYTIDGNGNTLTRATADSVVTTYTYDNLSRLTQISASGLSTISYAYDELSQRTSMSDGTGTTTYSYDRMGRLTQAAQPNGTLSYGYDLDSNRTTLTYPGSNAVTYTLSNAGRLSSLQDWGSRTTSYTYTPAGLAATATLPNGLVTTYTYDRAQRLTNLTNVVGSTTITSHAYTLDSEGNRTAQTEFVSGITSGSSDPFGYTYDGLNRLTSVTTTNAESFTLDSASNISSRTGPSATFSYDTSNRLTGDGGQSFTWSNADRLTARGSDSFGYDPLDRLMSSTVSSTSRTYAYNAEGLLQSRTQGGSTTNLLWDPATSPSRLLQVGSDKIVYGLGPLYVVSGSSTFTFARDGGKSMRAELNGSGAVTASFRYKAYGAIAQSNGASTPSYLGYAGQLLDPSGLYYMRARWYDPATGRFGTRDPVAGPLAPQLTSNVFAYGDGNPVTRLDPTGLMTTFTDVPEGCRRKCGGGNWLTDLIDDGTTLISSFVDTVGKVMSPPPAPDVVLDALAGDDPQQRAIASLAWQHAFLVTFAEYNGGAASADTLLANGERWLGPGYREINPGVFRSADGRRQFRITDSDLAGHRGGPPHVHFESVGPDGRILEENTRVLVRP
jgi:RHS repeat-associated protein